MRIPFVLGAPLLIAIGCGSSPPPEATNAEAPSASPSSAPSPSSEASVSPSAEPSGAPAADSVSSAQPASNPPPIVVHRSEIYATMVGRAGKVVRMMSLVTTSDTPIAPATKAVLLRKVAAGEGEDGGEWAPVADVVVKKIDAQANIELAITAERPADKTKKAAPWGAKGSSVKLRIDR